MTNILLKQLCEDKQIKLTPLRKEILQVLNAAKKPLGAYDILSKLKKKRPNAEPPTVYRVLEFLVSVNLVHRLEAQNTYVCCATLANHQHKTFLLFCHSCKKSFEFQDEKASSAIKKFAQMQSILVEDAVIEMKGTCADCLKHNHSSHTAT